MGLNIKRILYFVYFILTCPIALANVQSYASLWFSGVFIVPMFKNNEHWKYYFEPRLILIDDRYGMDEVHFYYGAGYKIAPNFTPFIGAAYFLSEDTKGVVSHENVLWEQFLWEIYKGESFKVSNRSRLEERNNTLFSEWATRLREQITFKFPFHNTKYSLVTFNEWFFNFNHPSWVSNKFFAQNRYYIGLEKKVTEHTSFDFGYINQIKFTSTNPNILSNGLYFKLSITR